jgi:hypothetical protein
MQEAEWVHDKYQPSFKEHEELSVMSTAVPMLDLMALMGYDEGVATQELFDWMIAPANDVVRAGGAIGRFLNSISSYKVCTSAKYTYIIHDQRQTSRANFDLIAWFRVQLGKCKKDVDTSVECYMREKGSTGEEAVAAIAAMTEHRWRVLNRAGMETDRALLPGVQLVVSLSRMCEVIHHDGRDVYTFGSDAKDLVTALFLDPIPL